jgi:hypothetical protein
MSKTGKAASSGKKSAKQRHSQELRRRSLLRHVSSDLSQLLSLSGSSEASPEECAALGAEEQEAAAPVPDS